MVGTHLALAPVLERLSGGIAATADYFEFQRLAGRAGSLQISVLGTSIAGFSSWLADMLQTGVSDVATPDAQAMPVSPTLNLLEGMRTGLLKVGNQEYDFVGGHFIPSMGAQSGNGANGSAGMALKWKSASSQQVTLENLKPLAKPIAAAAFFALAIGGSYAFVLAPIHQESETSANLYSGMLSRMDQANAHAAQTSGEPVLWARDLISVGAAMPYDMKLKRIALVQGQGTLAPAFELSGILPKGGGDNLQLIGRFMTRFSALPGLRRRFTEVNFAGVGDGDNKDGEEAVFKIVGKVAVGAKP
jgi:hypothetical protein